MSLDESTVEAAALEWFRRRRAFSGQVGGLRDGESETVEFKRTTGERRRRCFPASNGWILREGGSFWW